MCPFDEERKRKCDNVPEISAWKELVRKASGPRVPIASRTPFGVCPVAPGAARRGPTELPTVDIRQMHFLCSTLLVCGRYDLLPVYSRIQISSCWPSRRASFIRSSSFHPDFYLLSLLPSFWRSPGFARVIDSQLLPDERTEPANSYAVANESKG